MLTFVHASGAPHGPHLRLTRLVRVSRKPLPLSGWHGLALTQPETGNLNASQADPNKIRLFETECADYTAFWCPAKAGRQGGLRQLRGTLEES